MSWWEGERFCGTILQKKNVWASCCVAWCLGRDGVYGLMTKSSSIKSIQRSSLQIEFPLCANWGRFIQAAGSSFELSFQKTPLQIPGSIPPIPSLLLFHQWDRGRGGCCLRHANSCHIAHNRLSRQHGWKERKQLKLRLKWHEAGVSPLLYW